MFRKIAVVILCQIVFVGILAAQTNRATVTGTVTDSSGAVVPGVAVTATRVDTGVATSSVTNSAGIYTVLNLVPARYTLEFKKAGFKSLVEHDILLHSTQAAQINVRLAVGGVTQVVTVTTHSPVLDKENATIGTNMSNQVVTDLPLSIYGGAASLKTLPLR